MTEAAVVHDEQTWPLDTVCDMLREAIQASHFEDPEIKPELLRNLGFLKSRYRDSRTPPRQLTGHEAVELARRLLTGFGSPVYRLPDDERRALVACIITGGAAMESATGTRTTFTDDSKPEQLTMKPGPDGWSQYCAICGEIFKAKSLKARFCSDRCRVRSYDRRQQAKLERERAAAEAS